MTAKGDPRKEAEKKFKNAITVAILTHWRIANDEYPQSEARYDSIEEWEDDHDGQSFFKTVMEEFQL